MRRSRRPDASSSSLRRAPRARPSSSRWDCTSTRCSSASTARTCAGSPRPERGFGIVAGTGTGKTLAIRPIAERILGAPLRVGVVNREREATPETPTWNVVIVTTGIARRWFEDGLITSRDTLVVDEIHQTSAELELCLALGKRARCRFIWLSATVDPTLLRALPRFGRSAGNYGVRPGARGAGPGRAAAAARLPGRAVRAAGAEGASRRGRLRSHPRRSRGARRPIRGAVAATDGRVLPRRRADPRHPSVPGRRGGASVPARDDRRRSVRPQRPRTRHGRDLRRPLRQRRRPRPQRAHPALPRRERDPPDGRPGARPRRQRRGLHPERPRPRIRRARAPRRRSSSWQATPSGWRSPAPRSAWTRPSSTCRCRSTAARTATRCSCSPSGGSSKPDGSRATDAPSKPCRSSGRGASFS